MPVASDKRQEITAWALERALEEAKRLGRAMGQRKRHEIDYEPWLQAMIWHYEKMAYLKIERREKVPNRIPQRRAK